MIRPIISLSSNKKDDKIGITYTISSPENIENSIKPNTKLIAVTHGSNVTGAILDIEKIGKISKKHNIALLVDAAQTAGEIPIDVEKMNINFLAAPGHKALFGPQGTGILYIRDGISLSPIKEGVTGSFSEFFEQPSIMPDSLESGTLNSPGIIGLGAGIKFILSEKIEKITEHKDDLTKYFLDGLKNISGVKIYGINDRNSGYIKQLGVISINIKEELSKNISYALDNIFNIATRAGLHCAPLAHETIGTKEIGTVRFSLSYFNTREDINKGLYAISQISKSV
jgi:selenocysteine lyase/cysteine desulfurase